VLSIPDAIFFASSLSKTATSAAKSIVRSRSG
jgi:hypothetical protein